MSSQKKEWYYFDETQGKPIGPLTLDELDAQHQAGKFEQHSHVTNTQMIHSQGPMTTSGIPYSMISRLEVEFEPSVEEFYKSRNNKPITIVSGPNNCGKTLLLKQIYSLVGHGGYLIACSRFSHVSILNTRNRDEDEYRRYYDNFVQNLYTSQQNNENNERQLEQVITGLKNPQRTKLFGICKDLLGNTFSLQRTDPDNDFSPYFVDMDGENLQYGSSGTRLLLTLLGILLDEEFRVILIDEPEIGLSPNIQAVLARFLYDSEQRKQFFPHLQQLYIATHSHLFLDRNVFSNNYVVTKAGSVISTKPINSIGDFHRLQFNMLGNDLESLFLPSAIVIVEGDSDVVFLTKVIQLHIPERKIAIVRAQGDGGVGNKLRVIKEAFGDLAKSPFRDRLFVILDRQNSVRVDRIKQQGVPEQNIVVWSENGIEYYYPKELVAQVFSSEVGELEQCNFERDPIEFKGIRKSKKELAELVSEGMTTSLPLHTQVNGLLENIREACG